MGFNNTIPIFRIFDVQKATQFYVEFLGFAVQWKHRFEDGLPLYMEIARDECTIHLSEHHGDCCPGAAARIATDDLDGLHDELSGTGYEFARPNIDDTPWGTREMSVKDPFGNRLTFVQTSGD